MREISQLHVLIPFSATLGLYLALRGPSPLYFLILFFFLVVCFFQCSAFRKRFMIVLVPFLIYYFIGCFSLSQQSTFFEEEVQSIFGKIHSQPNIDGDSLSFRFKSDESEVLQVQAFLYSQGDQVSLKQLEPGDACMITGKLTPPFPSTNFGQFDYRKYLKEQNIFWILRPEKGGIQCMKTNGNFLLGLKRWRHNQIRKIEQQVHPEYSGIMNALLFGDRSSIDGDVMEAYQRLGVIHLLAVSGMHVGMIVTMLFYTLLRIGLTRERTIEILLSILPFYIIIAGAAPSVIRAAIMAMVILVCLRFNTNVSPLTGISVVYLIYLSISPLALFHLGFQLSFLISFGLLISVPVLKKRYISRSSQLIAVTFLSQFLSFPLLLHHMFEISLFAIPLNVIYIPFITLFALPLTLISFLLTFLVPYPFNYPLLLLEFVFPFIHHILRISAEIKFSSFVVGKPSLFFVFLYYLSVFYACLMWEKGNNGWWKKPTVVLCVLMTIQIVLPYVDASTKVTMIDVGQGDSILIELPYRKAIYLIDTGGIISFSDEEWRKRVKSFEVGADVIVPVLKASGISRIDKLILTHGHMDHIGGATALLKALDINEVYYGKGSIDGEFERELLTNFVRQGTTIKFVGEGVSWKDGSATFSILSPTGKEATLNDRSIVLYMETKGVSILFTGDLEESGERRIISAYPNLEVDILKAGHHGSRTSTTEAFLSHLSPKVVLISAGRNNRFNHPHTEVIERLEEHEINVFRTDTSGAVQLKINEKIKVKTAIEQ